MNCFTSENELMHSVILTSCFLTLFSLDSKTYISETPHHFSKHMKFSQSLLSYHLLLPCTLWYKMWSWENVSYLDIILCTSDCDIIGFCNWGHLKLKGKISIFHLLWGVGGEVGFLHPTSQDQLTISQQSKDSQSLSAKETQRDFWSSSCED